MMHTILKVLKCRWVISQNMANFSTCKNPQISRNLNKTVDVKSGGNFQYFGSFLRILRLARLLYVMYIKKIFDWSKNG